MHNGTEREERIREEAYRVWEQEGRPQGREREHWKEAVRRVEMGENGQSPAANPEASPARPSRQRKAQAAATKPRVGQRKPKSAKA